MPAFDDALLALDDRFGRFRDERGIPGVAWGVVRDGALVHDGGAGTAVDGEARQPDADTVFRIASMTKSFTAAIVLQLRDEGRLGLDDPVGIHVPQLAGWLPPVPGVGPVTIRRLLTMSAGLPTDDPWGDRQQGLPLDAFADLLAAGLRFAWTPGTVFDYSNLGYGILGRVITNVAGAEYREVVRDRLLVPLGMASTAYAEEDIEAGRLAHGYVRRGDGLVREGDAGYGALASMGGIFSTVRDLSRWVAGFLDAVPARPDGDAAGHPLRAATRREMQQVQSGYAAEVPAIAPDARPRVIAGGYGFGLFVTHDPDLGTFIGHAGGYPGYGSDMLWHPATGLGIVALANLRYARPSVVVQDAMRDLVRGEEATSRRHVRPWPEVDRCCEVAEALLAHWDDSVADAAFAMNMDLDEPREARRAACETIASDLGPFRRDATRPASSSSAAQRSWWLRGERGWVRLEILLTPEPAPRIQQLTVRGVGDASPALAAAARLLLAVVSEETAAGRLPRWPARLPTAGALDVAAIERTLAAAWARFGEMRLGLPLAGDGVASITWDLVTERGGGATLRLTMDRSTGAVADAALLAAEREPPAEPW